MQIFGGKRSVVRRFQLWTVRVCWFRCWTINL